MNPSLQGYDFYWKSWKVVEDWKRRHDDASLAAYNAQKSLTLHDNGQSNLFFEQNHYPTRQENHKRNEENKKYHDVKSGRKDMILNYQYDGENYCSSDDDSGSDDDDFCDDKLKLEFVINEEMIAFFEQSMKHKIELQKQRALDKSFSATEIDEKVNKNNKKEKNSKTKKKHSSNIKSPVKSPVSMQFPNVNFSCQKRAEEMSILYGDAAPKICGMETALQLSFNRLCDYNKPTYWPCIPFRP